ncbi:hypothetical protein [Nocardioides convexus]|uniref:endonuclease/exonuclease/phosphatase family protein n=1 Tax=Nocardioides convexus TaxID=2712224 RepID=UPI00241892AF|nr:hypothetical protein [Nocardioides convexus]
MSDDDPKPLPAAKPGASAATQVATVTGAIVVLLVLGVVFALQGGRDDPQAPAPGTSGAVTSPPAVPSSAPTANSSLAADPLTVPASLCPSLTVQHPFTVITFNIHSAIRKHGGLEAGTLIKEIKSWKPDLVLMQEVDTNRGRSGNVVQAQQIGTALGLSLDRRQRADGQRAALPVPGQGARHHRPAQGRREVRPARGARGGRHRGHRGERLRHPLRPHVRGCAGGAGALPRPGDGARPAPEDHGRRPQQPPGLDRREHAALRRPRRRVGGRLGQRVHRPGREPAGAHRLPAPRRLLPAAAVGGAGLQRLRPPRGLGPAADQREARLHQGRRPLGTPNAPAVVRRTGALGPADHSPAMPNLPVSLRCLPPAHLAGARRTSGGAPHSPTMPNLPVSRGAFLRHTSLALGVPPEGLLTPRR